MFENMVKFLKKFNKKDNKSVNNSKEAAKERLHLVLMQDRANVSADFLELMKQEIIEVIKKYIEVDESAIDVRLTNKENADGTNGAPALYANIPILNIKNEARKVDTKVEKEDKEKSVDNDKNIEQKDEKKDKENEKNVEYKTDSKVIENNEKVKEIEKEHKNENKEEKIEKKENIDKKEDTIKKDVKMKKEKIKTEE